MRDALIVLLGPTATGKTKMAIELARYFDTEIISADSRQFYREMKIGTAAPTDRELSTVKHHFIGSLSIKDYYNASMFEEEVLRLLPDLFAKNHLVLMAGGSGLYIDAVCTGIDELPTIDPEIRKEFQQLYQAEGIEGLRRSLKMVDPGSYERIDLRNPNRILKALEVSRMTGKPYSTFLTSGKKERPFEILKIGLNLPREELYNRINQRVDKMVHNGLVEEARDLYKYKELNALNTVGYKELFSHFEGEISLDKAIELIKRNTRRFAKRQLTWFQRDKNIQWFQPHQKDQILRWVDKSLIVD